MGKAQNTFVHYYGTSTSDYGTDVLQTVDGGYMQIIQAVDSGIQLPVLVKTDCRGHIEWTQGLYFDGMTSSIDMVNALGNAVVVLINYKETGTGNALTAVTKIDLNGNLVWCKSLALDCGFSNIGIIMENTGNFVLCGNPITTPASTPSIAIVKLHESGNILFQQKIDLPLPATVVGITVLPNGDYALAGTYPSSLPTFKDVFVLTVTNDLTFKNAVVADTYYDDEVYALTSDESGNIYLCGRSYFIGSAWDGMLIKFNSNLDLVFSQYYDAGTTEGEVFRDMVKSPSASLTVCGDKGASDDRNLVVAQLNYSGNIVFSKEFPVSVLLTNYLFKINTTAEGGYVATGDINPPFSFRDAPILKLNDKGEDNCFAQDFSFAKRNEVLVLNYVIGINSLINIDVHDTVPNYQNSLIHDNEICSTTGPCPAFVFASKLSCDNFCFDFTNQSSFATQWNWEFENGNPANSTSENPQNICFSKEGQHAVTLTVSDGIDTSVLVKMIEVSLDCEPVIPNIFTPNGDGINDEFEITHMPETYELLIYNRWGVPVYTANNEPQFWQGTIAGKKVAQGVYYYVFKNGLTGKEYHGFVQVSY